MLVSVGSRLIRSVVLRPSCLLALILILCCTSCDRPSDGFIFTYSHEQPAGSLRSESMEFFERELEKRTAGRIQVELFFGGVLGTERELMDFTALGALQGTRGGLFADANPKFNLLTLPFLVADWDQAIRLVNSDFMKSINEGARQRGWHVPATGISQGFRVHTNSKRPLTHPDDFLGLRMRVPPQDVFVQTALAFGANPQEIPAIEVYQALQTGRVDGQDNAASNIWDYKIYEVSRYMTITNYATGPDPFLVNLAWYESLPADLQQIFDEVAVETIAHSDKLNREKEQDYIERLSEKLEVNYVRGAALEPFRDAVQPVIKHYVDRGDFTWNEIESARKAARD
jgi:C4-dicarboxylate-binding protein DctP